MKRLKLYCARVRRDSWEGDYSALFKDRTLTQLYCVTDIVRTNRKYMSINSYNYELVHVPQPLYHTGVEKMRLRIGDDSIAERLEYLRGEIKKERISYGEIAELQSLAEYIDDDDVLLLEWAGVEEGARV